MSPVRRCPHAQCNGQLYSEPVIDRRGLQPSSIVEIRCLQCGRLAETVEQKLLWVAKRQRR